MPATAGSLYIQYQFDPLARLSSTVLNTPFESPANAHSYDYDNGDQRTRQTFKAGNYVDYTYDPIGQLKTALGTEYGDVTNRVNEQFGYGYDKAGNLNWRTNNALVQAFNVNNLNELTTQTNKGTLTVAGTVGSAYPSTTVTVSGTGLASGSAELYGDATWARAGAAFVNGNNSYTASATDGYGRISSDTVSVSLPGTNTFTYDLNGNLRTNGTRIFDYDDENQLIRITEPTAWKSEFSYDGRMRRRIRKEFAWTGSWTQTNEVRYIYDGNLVLQERWFDPQLSTPNPQQLVTYTRGQDLSHTLEGAGGIGGLLARSSSTLSSIALNGGGSTAYYVADGNGNITALLNTNGAIVARYEYDPFGNTISINGPLAGANLCRFSSKECHQNSGLIYYLYRYYDPDRQRWINQDPIGVEGGVNLYAFVENAPTHNRDYWGLDGSPVDSPTHAAAHPDSVSECAEETARNTAARKFARETIKDVAEKLKNLSKTFDKTHLKAAGKELEGKVVKINPTTGKPYDHITEVMNNWRGLGNQIEKLNEALGKRIPSAERELLQKQLTKCRNMDKFLRDTFQGSPDSIQYVIIK
jgi:RHS repeat-associated protein